MVDAGKIAGKRAEVEFHKQPRLEPGDRQFQISIHEPVNKTFERFASLGKDALSSPSQSIQWVKAWSNAVNPELLLVFAEHEGIPKLLLSLEVVREGGATVARFPGGTHANGNFPILFDSNEEPSLECLDGLIALELIKRRPELDLIHLERQSLKLNGLTNPLIGAQGQQSPNVALAADLSGGFSELLTSVNGKRKRKKHRSHTRKFEADGGYRIYSASTDEECDHILDFFFETKADRFKKAGIENVFASSEVQRFFRVLFSESLNQEAPKHVLNALEVSGKLRAVTGTSICGSRIISEFGAVDDGDTSRTSPGEYLYYETIRKACDEGYSVYDFSVGDEPYKRQWCRLEEIQYDTLVPLSPRGHLLAGAIRAKSALKRIVKRSPALFETVRKVRSISSR